MARKEPHGVRAPWNMAQRTLRPPRSTAPGLWGDGGAVGRAPRPPACGGDGGGIISYGTPLPPRTMLRNLADLLEDAARPVAPVGGAI